MFCTTDKFKFSGIIVFLLANVFAFYLFFYATVIVPFDMILIFPAISIALLLYYIRYFSKIPAILAVHKKINKAIGTILVLFALAAPIYVALGPYFVFNHFDSSMPLYLSIYETASPFDKAREPMNGKVVVVDYDPAKCELNRELSIRLPPDLVARSPDDVSTIIYLTLHKEVVADYVGTQQHEYSEWYDMVVVNYSSRETIYKDDGVPIDSIYKYIRNIRSK